MLHNRNGAALSFHPLSNMIFSTVLDFSSWAGRAFLHLLHIFNNIPGEF